MTAHFLGLSNFITKHWILNKWVTISNVTYPSGAPVFTTSHPIFNEVRGAHSVVFCVALSGSLFSFRPFFYLTNVLS